MYNFPRWKNWVVKPVAPLISWSRFPLFRFDSLRYKWVFFCVNYPKIWGGKNNLKKNSKYFKWLNTYIENLFNAFVIFFIIDQSYESTSRRCIDFLERKKNLNSPCLKDIPQMLVPGLISDFMIPVNGF